MSRLELSLVLLSLAISELSGQSRWLRIPAGGDSVNSYWEGSARRESPDILDVWLKLPSFTVTFVSHDQIDCRTKKTRTVGADLYDSSLAFMGSYELDPQTAKWEAPVVGSIVGFFCQPNSNALSPGRPIATFRPVSLNDRWRFVAFSRARQDTMFVDLQTLRRTPSKTVAWIKSNAVDGTSTKQLWEIDCPNNRYRLQEATYFDAGGAVVNSPPGDATRWLGIVPESLSEAVAEPLCAPGRLQLNARPWPVGPKP